MPMYLDNPLAAARAAEERRQLQAALARAVPETQDPNGLIPLDDQRGLAIRNAFESGGASMAMDHWNEMQSPTQPPVVPFANLATAPGPAIAYDPSQFANQMQPPPVPGPSRAQSALASWRGIVEPGPMEQEYNQQVAYQPPEQSGTWNRIKGIGKGLLMGGVGGAIFGGINPNQTARAYHRMQLSPFQHAAEVEQQGRGEQVKRALASSNITGIDPMTGLQTPGAEYKDAMAQNAELRAFIAQQNANTSQGRLAETQRRNTDIVRTADQNRAARLSAAGVLDPAGRVWAAEVMGMPPGTLREKFVAGAIKTNENFEFVDVRTGLPVLDADGRPMKSVVQTQEANETTRAHIQAEGAAAGRAETARHNIVTEGLAERRLSADEEKRIEDAVMKDPSFKPSRFADAAEQAANAERVRQEIERRKKEALSKRPVGTAPSGSKSADDLLAEPITIGGKVYNVGDTVPGRGKYRGTNPVTGGRVIY